MTVSLTPLPDASIAGGDGVALTALSRFNKAIGLAQDYLRRRDRQGFLISAVGWTDLAIAQIRRALSNANAMRDGARRSLCFRLLNWLRRPASASA